MADVPDRDELLYLYGVVPADAAEPDASLPGLEDGSVRLVRGERIAAVVSPVPGDAYSDARLESRMDDLQWVGERGLAHERVLDWFAERGPVVPLSLFSLHRDEARVRARLAADEDRLHGLLVRLRGKREWGIKLWRAGETLADHLPKLSPALRALEAEIEAAPPGRRFLLSKKRDTLRGEEVRSISRRVAHQAYASLREAADDAATMSLPAAAGGEETRTLLLHAAFLVAEDAFPAFQRRVGELARELGGVGFEIEFTGPWPPYHFTEIDGE